MGTGWALSLSFCLQWVKNILPHINETLFKLESTNFRFLCISTDVLPRKGDKTGEQCSGIKCEINNWH